MKKLTVRIVAALMLGVVAAAALAVTAGVREDVPAAHANPVSISMFNPGLCVALTLDPDLGPANGCITSNGLAYTASSGDQGIMGAANRLGNNNGVIEASDFAGIDTFSGRQLHQKDGADVVSLSSIAVVAIVASDAPVTFHASEGFFFTPAYGNTWVCTTADPNYPDSDCGGGQNVSPNANFHEDHAVVAILKCSVATCPNLGEQHLDVEQDGIIYPVTFTVVGEPKSVEFFTLETALQAGVPDDANGNPDCPFSASVSFFTKALGEAEKTIIIARALDINGTAVTGAWFDWKVNDKTKAALAQPLTPTLDLGGFGKGAPNILCVPFDAAPGSVTVTATLARIAQGTLDVDPYADGKTSGDLPYGTVSFTVGAAPADMTLTADPATIPCDGQATSTVSAAIVDADGNPVISGTAVKFDVLVLGTANPINTTTNDKGIATTTVAPLAGDARGVPVTVSVYISETSTPLFQKQILVNCAEAAPPAPGGGTGGTTAGGSTGGSTSSPGGTITGPNTGSGGLAAAGTLSWWPMLGLALGAVALVAARASRLTLHRERD